MASSRRSLAARGWGRVGERGAVRRGKPASPEQGGQRALAPGGLAGAGYAARRAGHREARSASRAPRAFRGGTMILGTREHRAGTGAD